MAPMRQRSPRPLLAALAALALLAAGCGGSDDDSGAGGSGGAGSEEVDWPLFGRVLERTQVIADAPNPPFHYVWEFFAEQLIEFPPVVEDGRLFVINKTGELFAIRISDGKKLWSRNLGNDVTGPAYHDGTVYLAQLDGTLAAIDADEQKLRWEFRSPSKLESSPLPAGEHVYLGSDGGYLYALRSSDGKLAWKAKPGQDIKASPSLSDGTVYVGDYEGGVHALEAASGRVRWSADTTQLPPGGSGGFYSSPSIAFGRVYEARDDGTVYAFDAESGRLDWHFQTDKPIYGSPAVAQIDGLGPTVFIGSYDHRLYALDAESGAKRWSFDVGGQIPGTPTVVGDTVYTSSFETKKTTGLDAKTGKPVFHWGSAGYTPLISDGEYAYLTGFQTVWAFDAKN